MNNGDWKMKQRALVLAMQPYIEPNVNIDALRKEVIHRKALFARWTSDWDCGHSTEWWYCLRDKKIGLEEFKSKVRNEINRGLRTTHYILCSDINELTSYQEKMFAIAHDCFSDYPSKYRPKLSLEGFIRSIGNTIQMGGVEYWLCIDKESNELVGFARCGIIANMCNLYEVKISPQYLKNRVNAGLVFSMCKYYLNEMGLRYICDGQRNIRHETNFQSFLVKTLGFRYAYCRLNVVYHPLFAIIVLLAYPFKSILKRFSVSSPLLYNAYCVLKQEEIARTFK